MVKRRMTRRWKIALWVGAVLVLAAGGLVVAFLVSAPAPSSGLAATVPSRDIPADWVTPGGSLDSSAAPKTEPSPSFTFPYVTTGRLALLANGKPFGEETYDLSIAEDATTLHSSGRFWFKVVLATVQVTFDQTLAADSELRPVRYAAQFHAPLGMDRSVRAAVDGNHAQIDRAGKEDQIAIDPERTVALGTFSTYALLPRLFALRQRDGSISFDALVLGGPPSQETAAADALPVTTVRYAGVRQLRAGDLVLDVEHYRVSSPIGDSDLYARGVEFLAFRAGDAKDVLWVYRADYFPDGVQIVGEALPIP